MTILEQSSLLGLYDIIGTAACFLIAMAFGLSVFWNTLFLLHSQKQEYTWIKIHTLIVSCLFVLTFIYLGIRGIIGISLDATIFATIVIRPLIFLAGSVFAASARARYKSLKHGGE